MSNELPGPSQHGRIAACITSEALPHARASNQDSDRGNVIHEFLADCINKGRDAALLAAPEEHREMLTEVPHDRLPPLDPTKYAAEVSFALNVKTGECREIGRGLTRDQARALAKEGELVGTTDIAGVTEEAFVLHDWKTGRGHIERAEVNWQTRAYAIMGARAYGRTHAVGSIVRILDDSSVWYDKFEMDSMELDSHESELRALMARREEVIAMPPEQRPPLHEGRHCKYCPALPFCPAKVTLLSTAFATGEPLSTEVVELTPERASIAWARIETAEKLLERLKAVVKDYARQTPFPTGDGYVVGEVTENREAIVANRANTILQAHLGPQLGAVVYSESIEETTEMTKKRLKSALGKYVLPTMPQAKITHLEKDTLEALRTGGAISVSSFKAVKEHKPKEQPKAAQELPETAGSAA